MQSSSVFLPGSTVGILGGGQLGRMLTMAAKRMGYRVHIYSDSADSPAGQLADEETVGAYDDVAAIGRFAKNVDVVTFEFENVSAAAVQALEDSTVVHPSGRVLHTAQNRLREKQFFADHEIPTNRFAAVRHAADLAAAMAITGLPAVLKTASSGYDGKGQRKVHTEEELAAAWEELGRAECILEEMVDFEREISVVGVRTADGEFAHFGVLENHHENHILAVTLSPARVRPQTARQAIEVARNILSGLHVVGVLTVEMFVGRNQQVLVNELAPRPHNSGHLTIEAARTSQFEQQLRAICGLPLGSSAFHSSAAMMNVLGDAWELGAPRWNEALQFPEVHLHLYGKADARPGRKMGHLTALARSPEQALGILRAAMAAAVIVPPPEPVQYEAEASVDTMNAS
jgi:5-(carboxyamino)imidazole ribonucleotide synthase